MPDFIVIIHATIPAADEDAISTHTARIARDLKRLRARDVMVEVYPAPALTEQTPEPRP